MLAKSWTVARSLALGAALVGVLVTAAVPVAQAPRQTSRKLALVGGMLLTGAEVPPVHHATVLIEGNKIVAAGPSSEIPVPPDATVFDTSGRTMMPGLIETHGHLVVLGHGSYETWFPWIDAHGGEKMLTKVMEVSARQLLMAGVTTTIDLGAPLGPSLSVRDRINKGEIPGTRALVSGPWLAHSRGGGAPGAMQVGFGGLNVTTPEQAVAEVERLAKAGVDLIKAHSGLSPAEYKAIADTAHRHRLKVYAHVYDEDEVRNALDAGIDVLTHVGSAGRAAYSPELISDIVRRGRPVVITGVHRSWLYEQTVDFPERLTDPRLKEAFGPEIYAEVQNSFKDWRAIGYFSTVDRQMRFRERGVRQFLESNAVVGMGTDSGTPMNFHSEALWREIKMHVDMGMTPARAIAAATRVNASIIGRRDLGSIEVGKTADVIVVNGNPLFDIVALSRVVGVVKDGVVYKGGPATDAKPRSTASAK
jgi:imidazolonepropionase-like amidohydrolase